MSTQDERMAMFQHIEDKFNQAMVSNDVEKNLQLHNRRLGTSEP